MPAWGAPARSCRRRHRRAGQPTPVENKRADGPALAGRYRAALGRFGADPEAVPPDEAAAQLAGSAVWDRLVAGLDRWLREEKLPWVRAVLRVADSDPYRDAV